MAIFSLEEVPPRTRMPAHPKNRDIDPEAYDKYIEYLKNEQIRDSINKEKEKIKLEQKIENRNKAAIELNRRKNLVMMALTNQAKNPVFTNKEYKEAINNQIENKRNIWNDYKKGINATVTAAELGLSGASLLGAYSNWRNWINSSIAAKRNIANILQKAQLPMQIGGTLIDSYQTYDAIQRNNDFEKYYNLGSAGLGVGGSIGAADMFRNTRLNYPYIDRIFDTAGVIQNAGDFIKFGYDIYNNNDK